MNQAETAQVLGMLAVEYDHAVVTPERVELWAALFADVAFADAKAAVFDWFRDAEQGRFFPRPAELRGLVRAHLPKLDAALYGDYARLRRRLQTGDLTAGEARRLAAVERRLGIDKPAPAGRTRPAIDPEGAPF